MTDEEFWRYRRKPVKLIKQTKGQQNMNKDEFVVKDSGNREHFTSGAVRDTADDKPRPDLISPFILTIHKLLRQHLRG